MIGASVRLKVHARDRMKHYAISQMELLTALGSDVLAAGRIACVPAGFDPTGKLRAPAQGQPILIGRQFPQHGERAYVLLAIGLTGRRIHVLVTVIDGVLDVLTIWLPDASENRNLWMGHAQRPTLRGEHTLPPTVWLLDGHYQSSAKAA